MDLDRKHFRAMIFYDFRAGLTKKQCVDRLHSVFGDKAPGRTTVYDWFNEFKRGRTSLADESREGRPKSVVVPENIKAVRQLLAVDRHLTYRELEATLGISKKSLYTILHEHLAVKRLCSRWIPQNLTIAQKKARVDWCNEMLKKYDRGASNAVHNIYTGDESWLYAYESETEQQSTEWAFQDEPNPTKVLRSRSNSKQMVATFFGIMGHIATIPLEECKTVNSEWYTTICLPDVIGKIRKINRRGQIILHHDNADSHTTTRIMEFLTPQNVELMDHPPNSPDLAPNDFYLFPYVRNKLRGQRFSTPEEAVETFKTHVSEIPQTEWKKCYEHWFQRMQKCIDHLGEYFDQQ